MSFAQISCFQKVVKNWLKCSILATRTLEPKGSSFMKLCRLTCC